MQATATRVTPRRRRLHVSPGTWFVLPAAFLVLAVIGYPFLYAVWISLTDLKIAAPATKFVAFANYGRLFADETFRRTLQNTVTYAGGSVLFSLIFGMAMALGLNRIKRGRDSVAAVMMIPWVIPTVISTLVWYWMFNPLTGILNYILMNLHFVSRPVEWLSAPAMAMLSVVVVRAWRTIPYFGVTILAALKNVPKELYEAAIIDGAGPINVFRHVTIPSIRSVLLLTSALTFVESAYDFAVIFILTRGGPGGATEVLSTMTFRTAFETGQLGLGAAVALAAFPILAPIVFIIARMVERDSQ